jgi:hypothetical protein
MIARGLAGMVKFMITYITTLTVALPIMATIGPAWTQVVVSLILAGLALKAWRRRTRPARIVERRARRMTVQWRWRGDGLGKAGITVLYDVVGKPRR